MEQFKKSILLTLVNKLSSEFNELQKAFKNMKIIEDKFMQYIDISHKLLIKFDEENLKLNIHDNVKYSKYKEYHSIVNNLSQYILKSLENFNFSNINNNFFNHIINKDKKYDVITNKLTNLGSGGVLKSISYMEKHIVNKKYDVITNRLTQLFNNQLLNNPLQIIGSSMANGVLVLNNYYQNVTQNVTSLLGIYNNKLTNTIDKNIQNVKNLINLDTNTFVANKKIIKAPKDLKDATNIATTNKNDNPIDHIKQNIVRSADYIKEITKEMAKLERISMIGG